MYAHQKSVMEEARREEMPEEEESSEELETATLVNITIQQQENVVLNDKFNM